MKRMGQEIFESDYGYKVYGVMTRDVGSRRMSCQIYTVSPDGKMSDLIKVTRKDIITNSKALDCFYELEGDFGRDDIVEIKNAVTQILKGSTAGTVVDMRDKAPMEEIYSTVCRYISENAEDLKDNDSAGVFVKDGLGCIETKRFEEFVKEYKDDLGYKRIELLNRLKIMGALAPGKDRPYDACIKLKGKTGRYYRVVMPEMELPEEETDKEVLA